MKFDYFGRWLPIIRRLPHNPADQVAPKQVALSFDDGPTPQTTPGLLALLRQAGATATFFLSGCRAVDHPDLVEAIVAAGHSVYAHGWDHVRLDRVSPAALIEAMARTEALLARVRPTPVPYLIRLPYAGGYRNPRVHATLRHLWPQGQIAHWSAHFGDPELAARCRTAEDVAAAIPAIVATALDRPDLAGCVLLMHELAFDIDSPVRADVSLRLTEALLAALRARQYRVTAMQPLASPPAFSRFLLR